MFAKRALTLLAILLLFAGLSGCGSGGRGGGGWDGNFGGRSGRPSVTGNTYHLQVDEDGATVGYQITLGPTAFVAESDSGSAYWGSVAVLQTGFVQLTPTGSTSGDPLRKPVAALEMPKAFLFLLESDDCVPLPFTILYLGMAVAYDTQGVCPTGTYNAIRAPVHDLDRRIAKMWGQFTFSGTSTVSLASQRFLLADTLQASSPDTEMNASGLTCAAGQASNGADSLAFTASGTGTFTSSVSNETYIALPQPASAILPAEVTASGKQYRGVVQTGLPIHYGRETPLDTRPVMAVGSGSVLNIARFPAAEVAFPMAMGTLNLAQSIGATAVPDGMFDNSTFTGGGLSNVPARVAVQIIGGKLALLAMMQADPDPTTDYPPGDWMFLVLMEQ